MTVEKVICDECGRVKGEANHWHQIGVQKYAEGVWVELGVIGCHSDTDAKAYEVHDLCGEQCLHKHIAKLLGFNPPAEVPLFVGGNNA